MIEPCSTCEHAGPPKEGYYSCAAHGFNLIEDMEIFPKLCMYFKQKKG